MALKKHQVNRIPGKSAKKRNRRTTKRASALGLGITAALALTGAPGIGATTIQSVSTEPQPEQMVAVAYVEPVTVGLQSGVDAINWEYLEFTSQNVAQGLSNGSESFSGAQNIQGAPVLAPGSANGLESIFIGSSSSARMSSNVGMLGALPGNLQLIHPVSSRHITSPYGWRNNPTGSGTQIHIGQDYAIACGSPVYATEDGTVIQSAWAGHSGMRVTIDHGSSVRTGYSHNSKLIAKVGDVVKQGQLIALSGTTGNSTGCHVHFEVIINGKWNDPRNFLPAIPGQPNPIINSRNTTITAEPIRNVGTPRADAPGVYDLELVIPEKPKSEGNKAPTSEKSPKSEHTAKPQPASTKNSDKPKASSQNPQQEAPAKPPKEKPVKPHTPKPDKEHKPSPPAEQKPAATPTPSPKPSPKPVPENKPAPTPPAETTPAKDTESVPKPAPTATVPNTEQGPSTPAADPDKKPAAEKTAPAKDKPGTETSVKASGKEAAPAPDSQKPPTSATNLETARDGASAKTSETKKVTTTAKVEQPAAKEKEATASTVKPEAEVVIQPKGKESTSGQTEKSEALAKSAKSQTIQAPAAKTSDTEE